MSPCPACLRLCLGLASKFNKFPYDGTSGQNFSLRKSGFFHLRALAIPTARSSMRARKAARSVAAVSGLTQLVFVPEPLPAR
jgi:hypothetical protein